MEPPTQPAGSIASNNCLSENRGRVWPGRIQSPARAPSVRRLAKKINEDARSTLLALNSDLSRVFLEVYASAMANNADGRCIALLDLVKGRFARTLRVFQSRKQQGSGF